MRYFFYNIVTFIRENLIAEVLSMVTDYKP